MAEAFALVEDGTGRAIIYGADGSTAVRTMDGAVKPVSALAVAGMRDCIGAAAAGCAAGAAGATRSRAPISPRRMPWKISSTRVKP